ncbi:acetyltransferase [Algibacter mikhailovii]|uniref:acetyltransferase n=1 Tax=Algibacter mikhailovii TaxID=425498 RepID=UPI002494E93E|nr:acetyltransferase [Algibacter mikhailovii]
MKDEGVIIIGAGGHGTVVASILLASNIKVLGYYDDDIEKQGKTFLEIPVLGKISDLVSDSKVKAIIGIGNNKRRKEIAQKFHFDWVNAIHPFSWISPDVNLGKGTIVCAGAIIQTGSTLGDHVVINTKASVDHDCVVGNYSHVAVAHLAGGVSIGEGVFVALNSTVLPVTNVGDWSIVGAGSVVTKDVLPNKTVVGIPARPI